MKITTFLLLCLIGAASAFAQQPTQTPVLYTPKTIADMEQLQKAALASDYAYSRLAHLSNNIGPRLTGSPQAQKAVDYVADEMRMAGLTVTLQKLAVPHWVRGVETGEVVQWVGMAPGTAQKIVLAALGGSVATPAEGITADVVVVNNFDELATIGREKIAGKIVLFNNKFDTRLQDSGFGLAAYGQAVNYRFNGAVQGARYGAIAVLVRSAGASQNRLVHVGAMGYDENVSKIPTAAVSYEDAELLAALAAAGTVRVHLTLTPQTLPDTTSYNVIADLKGSEKPDEVVVVGGHLDSWDLGTGAIDDGAGVVVSMQAGYLIKSLGLKPKRTIRVVAFMNEENGGVGGREYGNSVKDAMDKQFAAIESDLGASHPVGFNFSGKREALPFFAPISKVLLDQGAAQVQYQFGGVGSDIGPLTRAGVPSFAPWFDQRSYFLYHHTAADTLDKVDPKQLAENGAVVAVLAYGLANLETSLPR